MPAAAASGACGAHANGSRWCEGEALRVCESRSERTVASCASIERCDANADAGACAPACPAGEVFIPPTGAGGFVMGRGKLEGNRDRKHKVVLTRPFCMDETEVTTAAYQACVETKQCEPPGWTDPWANWKKKPDHPINLVSWVKAKRYCEVQGKTLPTEAQWEWAATGGDGRSFPWGNDAPEACDAELMDFTPFGAPKWAPGGDWGCRGGGTSPVRSFPKGARTWPAGNIYDLAGNVWEWVLDAHLDYPAEPQTDPLATNPRTIVHSIRGGGWNRPGYGCTTWYRGGAVETYQVPGLGFRCVRNPS
jgi:formylglycine-generating enzyme required for sulfatase activity